MTLIYRIKRLVKADAHAIVEGLEDPKWILAQSIRDMELELEKQSILISDKSERLERLRKQFQNSKSIVEHADKDIELAMEEKREDIAKTLIRKIIINKKNMDILKEQEEILQKEILVEGKELTEKKQAYDEICSRSQTVAFPSKKDDVFHESKRLVEKETSLEHEVELEFLRRLKKSKGGKNAE